MNQAQAQAFEQAQQETPITKQALLQEIKAALSDYFIAQAEDVMSGIKLQFPNGQRFILNVREV